MVSVYLKKEEKKHRKGVSETLKKFSKKVQIHEIVRNLWGIPRSFQQAIFP